MDQRPGLDNAADAGFAWARFRRMLWMMNLAALGVSAISVAYLHFYNDGLPLLFAGIVFGGVYATILMAAALMGLMFLSNGTGHDEQIIDLDEGDHPLDD